MNTEREMLEAAARAMGLQQTGWLDGHEPMQAVLVADGDYQRLWNPLNDGAQALDLAAALRISVEHDHPHEPCGWVLASINGENERVSFIEDVPTEELRADRMRLAILRCAAAQALKSLGAGGPETGPETAEPRMDTGFHRGPEVCPDTVLLEGAEACQR